MKKLLPFAILLLSAPAWGHPHEWVDWGAGLALNEAKPVKALSVNLELTWDELFSAVMLSDFPRIEKGTMTRADLDLLDKTYGLSSPDRAVSLQVTFRGKPITVRPVLQTPRTDGKQVTLVYALALGITVDAPGDLAVEIYDPTYYTDMGIRAKDGAYFIGVKDPAAYTGRTQLKQDMEHPYFGGMVYPELVVFALRP
jgi:ABC-type uncharacterized transport system substrate-binding protein